MAKRTKKRGRAVKKHSRRASKHSKKSKIKKIMAWLRRCKRGKTKPKKFAKVKSRKKNRKK
jgi:hypothetical protein